jgi:hypothetical protein
MKNTQECVCSHCDKKFSSHYTLQTHIKTAKYCLKIRGDKLDTNHICEHCNAQFTQKIALVTHLRSCRIAKKSAQAANVKKHDDKVMILEKTLRDERRNHEVYYENSLKTIEKLKSHLRQEKDKNTELVEKNKELKQSDISNQQLLKEKDAKINEQNVKIKAQKAKIVVLQNENATGKGILIGMNNAKPQTINKNITKNTNNTIVRQKLALIPIDNIQPLTTELIKEHIDKYYDYGAFKNGILGIENFIKRLSTLKLDNGTVEKNYASTNDSRYNFHRLAEDKEWERDAGAKYIHVILTALAKPASKYMKRLTEEIRKTSIDSPQKEILVKREEELRDFEYGLINEGTKQRQEIFDQLKIKVRSTNGC